MSKRTITGHITQYALTDLKDGGYAVFAVDYDSGAEATASVSSVMMNLTDIRSYSTTAYLQVRFDSPTGDVLAITGAMSGDQTIHGEDIELVNATDGLITETPSTIYIGVVSTGGTGNKINFREECCITLEIEYTFPPSACTPATNLELSTTESSGEAVTLSWTAGSGGTNNEFVHYRVMAESGAIQANGEISWNFSREIAQVTETSYQVKPPGTYNMCVRYTILTVGTAGLGFAATSRPSDILTRKRPDLVAYTDQRLRPGETRIKAVHMLELQHNINLLREGMGLPAVSFTEIRAGYTSLADWTAHVEELRAAIEDAYWEHEIWIPIYINTPTTYVIDQLRRVVAAV